MTDPLLSVRGVSVTFPTDAGIVQATDEVSFDVYPGETLAVVGESGSGKSVTAMSIMRLTESQRGTIESGEIFFEGRNLLTLPEDEMRRVRGNRIGMIFQEPMTSLNPVYTLGTQIAEGLSLHYGLSHERARSEAIHLLELVRMPAASRRVDEYPHQLSGGMRQRAMIAMALSCRPALLIADEPTTALDVTVQAQILELLAQLQRELGMALLLITHDLGVVAGVAHRALVMYAGRVVEQADVADLFERPRHPYTAGLFRSLPRLDHGRDERAPERLQPIEGNVPDALSFPEGCRFHPRCPRRLERCSTQVPRLREQPGAAAGKPRSAACFLTEAQPEVDYLEVEGSASGGLPPEVPA